MRTALPLVWASILVGLVPLAPARAQGAPLEVPAEDAVLELVRQQPDLRLVMDEGTRAALRGRQVTRIGGERGLSKADALATIEAILELAEVTCERRQVEGAPGVLLVVRKRPPATPAPGAPAPGAPAPAGPGARLGVVDLDAVFAAHPRKAALEAHVNGLRERAKAELDREQARLRELRARLQQGGDPRLEAEVQAAARALEAHAQEAQRALKEQVEQAMGELRGDVDAAVAAAAQREGLAAVVARRGPEDGRGRVVVWSAAPAYDLTAAATEALRQRAAAPPAPGERRAF